MAVDGNRGGCAARLSGGSTDIRPILTLQIRRTTKTGLDLAIRR